MTKTESKPVASPDDLLKAAVAGKVEAKPESGAKPEPAAKPESGAEPEPGAKAAFVLSALPIRLRADARLLGAAGAALAFGAALGAGVTALSSPGRSPNDGVAAMSATVDAGRIETARLSGEVSRLNQALADLRTATDVARKEATARGTALGERLGQIDRTIVGKLAALSERIDQSEREQNARIAGLATQADRRPAAPTPIAAAKAEPTQTGSLADAKHVEAKPVEAKSVEAKSVEAKPSEAKAVEAKVSDPKPKPVAEKPAVLDGWALRDVFDGAAILENRRRRIVEVGPGDTLPGVGRVEAVERRGRDWVVVTRQGIVTAQPW